MSQCSQYVLPADTATVRLLGGTSYSGVTLTPDQHQAVLKLYGYDPHYTELTIADNRSAHMAEVARVREENAKLPSWQQKSLPAAFNEKEQREFLEAGSTRDMLRAASDDGLRVVALLAKYMERGEDPVNAVARLMVAAGWDVPDWRRG